MSEENNIPEEEGGQKKKATENSGSAAKEGFAKGGVKGATKNVAGNTTKNIAGNSKAGQKANEIKETAENVANNTRRISQFASAVANKANSVIQFHASFTPWIWIIYALIILVIVLIISVIATSQTVGRNDNRDVCEDSASARGMVGNLGTSISETERAEELGSYLMTIDFNAFGGTMSIDQVAGLIGNLKQESGANPRQRQGIFPAESESDVPDNDEIRSWIGSPGRAIGLIQWDSDRAVALVDFAEDQGMQWYDGQAQLDFLAHELDSGYEHDQIVNNSRLTGGNTAEGYAAEWSSTFFRPGVPHIENRQAGALEFLTYFEGGTHNTSRGIVNCGGEGSLSMPDSPEGMECADTGYTAAEEELNTSALLAWRCVLEAFPPFQEAADNGWPYSLCRPGDPLDHGQGNAIDFMVDSGVDLPDGGVLQWNNHPNQVTASLNDDFNQDTMDYAYSLIEWLIEYEEYFDLEYLIFADKIWYRHSGFEEEHYGSYPGGGGIPKSDYNYRHLNHVHASFNGPDNQCRGAW